MIVIAAIDNNYGMMFNHRRVSQDRVLRDRIIRITKGSSLWMDEYSAGQFDPLPDNAEVSRDFLEKAGRNDFCFIEDRSILPYKDQIREVLLFRWNRDYPSDFSLDFIPDREGMHLTASEDFSGYSHEKITMETWRIRIIT